MTWTYSGDPATSDRDAVRFYTGDTITTDPLLTDAEIDYLLSLSSNILSVAAQCCEAIASKFAREADAAIGKTKIWASQKATAYTAKAASLAKKAYGLNVPYVGGLSKAEKTTDQADTNLVQPTFTKGIHDLEE